MRMSIIKEETSNGKGDENADKNPGQYIVAGVEIVKE